MSAESLRNDYQETTGMQNVCVCVCVCVHKMDFPFKNSEGLICHKIQPTNINSYFIIISRYLLGLNYHYLLSIIFAWLQYFKELKKKLYSFLDVKIVF